MSTQKDALPLSLIEKNTQRQTTDNSHINVEIGGDLAMSSEPVARSRYLRVVGMHALHVIHVSLLVEPDAVAGNLAIPLVRAGRVPRERYTVRRLEPGVKRGDRSGQVRWEGRVPGDCHTI